MAKRRHQVDITMLYAPDGPSVSRAWLRRVALSGISVALSESQQGPIQMGLVIAGDETLQDLNKEYRGADEVTDVLSFSWEHEGHWEGDDDPPKDAEADVPWPIGATPEQDHHPLGEVVVSYPQAQRQAQARGAETEQELALLVVHGILHLAGFDHVEPEEEARMKAREEEALGRVWKKTR